MVKLGILLCAYGYPEYVEPCLYNWFKIKEKYDLKIASVHGQFKEMHDFGYPDEDYNTQTKLKLCEYYKKIDFLYCQKDYSIHDNDSKIHYQTEAQMRDHGLQWLLKNDCDLIWLLDLDEFYSFQEIENIIQFITNDENQYTGWFKINFKNYFGSHGEWLDGFCPARIFRNKYKDFRIDKFYFDNDILYINNTTEESVLNSYFSVMEIPRNVAHVKHLSWVTNEQNKKKINYQLAHFHGACSYKEDKRGNIIIDNNFYLSRGLTLPIINK